MALYELPPILSGTAKEQIAALRDYLVRISRQLSEAESAPAAEKGLSLRLTGEGRRLISTGEDAAADTEAVRKNAAELRALIVKTSRELGREIEQESEEARLYADGRIEKLSSKYLSRSEFGAFTENVESQIATTARGVVESYGFTESIESGRQELALMQSYMTEINGQIRRGIVTDPATGEAVTGIAISQSLRFTGEIVRGGDGAEYYRLASGQTFGLYTATGWQFWIDGCKKGWYDSVDGMLHIANVAVEDRLQLGGGWQLVSIDGLGLRFTGE